MEQTTLPTATVTIGTYEHNFVDIPRRSSETKRQRLREMQRNILFYEKTQRGQMLDGKNYIPPVPYENQALNDLYNGT